MHIPYEEYIAKSDLYNSVSDKLNEKNPVYDVTTERGVGSFTGGFFCTALGHLWAGPIALGPLAIALGVAGAGAGIIAGVIALIRRRRKKNLKKEITAAAEEYKELYKDAVLNYSTEMSKKVKGVTDPDEIKSIAAKCKKVLDIKKEKMDAIEKEIDARIADTTRKGGNNDPELIAWKAKEFNRVRVEACEEVLKEDLDDSIIEAIEANIKEFKEKAKKLTKTKFEFKKGNRVPIGGYDDSKKEEFEKLYDNISEDINESALYSSDFFTFYGDYAFLNEAETQTAVSKLYYGTVKYDTTAEGIGEYVKDNKLSEDMAWTFAQDEDELKKLNVKDDDRAPWYDGMYIYTMSKEDAEKKLKEVSDDLVELCATEIGTNKTKKDDGFAKAVAKVAYTLTIIMTLKDSYKGVEVKNEKFVENNLLFSLNLKKDDSGKSKIAEAKYDLDNHLACMVKSKATYDGDEKTDLYESIVDNIKQVTKDIGVEGDAKKEIESAIEKIESGLKGLSLKDEKSTKEYKDEFLTDLSKVSDRVKTSSSDEEENPMKFSLREETKTENTIDKGDSVIARKAIAMCAFINYAPESKSAHVFLYNSKSGKNNLLGGKLLTALGLEQFQNKDNDNKYATRFVDAVSRAFKEKSFDENETKKIIEILDDMSERVTKMAETYGRKVKKFERKLESIEADDLDEFIDKVKDIIKSTGKLSETEVVDYIDYIGESKENVSEDYLTYVSKEPGELVGEIDEKWGIGVLVVNKKIDKMGENLKQALIDAKMPSLEAANLGSVDKYKNTPKDKQKNIAKKLNALSRQKEESAKSMQSEMETLCKESGIGKGGNDPRCLSHCRYVIAKAQKDAISEILKKAESFLDDETKKELKELEKTREEQVEQGKAEDGKPVTELKIREEDLQGISDDDKGALYDGPKEEDGHKYYERKYKGVEDFKEKNTTYKDANLVIYGEGTKDKSKDKWPEGFENNVKEENILPWYGEDKLYVMPCPDAETLGKEAEIKEFFSALYGKDTKLEGTINAENFGSNVYEYYEKLDDDKKKKMEGFFKFALLCDTTNADKAFGEELDKKTIEGIFAEDGPIFNGQNQLIVNIIGSTTVENIKEFFEDANGSYIPKDKEGLAKVVSAAHEKANEFITAIEDIKSGKKNTLAENYVGLCMALNRTWRAVGGAKTFEKFPSKQLEDLYNAIFSDDPEEKVTQDNATYDDFKKAALEESYHGVLKLKDWLLEEKETSESKPKSKSKKFNVDKAVEFLTKNFKELKYKKHTQERLKKIKGIIDEIQGKLDELHDGEEEAMNKGVYPSKVQQKNLKNIANGGKEINIKLGGKSKTEEGSNDNTTGETIAKKTKNAINSLNK